MFLLLWAGAGRLPGAVVARWVAGDLPAGPVTVWQDRISNRPANGVGGVMRDSTGVLFSGNNYCEVPSVSNPLSGDNTFTVTVACKVGSGATRNGLTPGNAATWWGNGMLVGRELPGANRGDWGLAVNALHGALAGRGNPDGGIVSAEALNDGRYHVISGVFNGSSGTVSLFVNGTKVGTATGVGTSAIEAESVLFGVNIVGNADTTFFTGAIQEIQMDNEALADSAVLTLQTNLLNSYRNGPAIQSFTATPASAYEGQSILLKWQVATNKVAGTFSWNIKLDGAVIASGSQPTSEVTRVIPDLAGQRRPLAYEFNAVETGGYNVSASAVAVVEGDPGIPVAQRRRGLVVNAPGSLDILLSGSDPNGGSLSFVLGPTAPARGTLSGTPPQVRYTPHPNARGEDVFGFRVSDGKYLSAEALVHLAINPPPAPPTRVTLDAATILNTRVAGEFLANISSPDINLNESHQFSLVEGPGSEQNAHFTIQGHHLRAAISFSALTGQSQRLRIRSTDSSGLMTEAAFVLEVIEPPGRVVINEVHYHGVRNTVRNDFIELHNAGSQAVSLAGWRLSGAVDYAFPPDTVLGPGAFLLIAEHPPTVSALWGKTALGPYSGKLGRGGETIRLRNPVNSVMSEVDYQVGFPWPVASDGDGASMELIHPSLDESLGSNWRASVTPNPGATVDTASPGAVNLRFSPRAPPAIRQVRHVPKSPRSLDPVRITARVTDPDGVQKVELLYQVVTPGTYLSSTLPRAIASGQFAGVTPATPNPPLPPNPAFESASAWKIVEMNDSGTGADETVGDSLWSAELPEFPHRTLVRYRIRVTDLRGDAARVPYADDPSLNFAFFVYDGVPDYQGTSSADLTSLPTYHFLTQRSSYLQCVGYNPADRVAGGTPSWQYENWEGALVYNGVVYDHVRYRLHGGNGRYLASGNPSAGQTSKRSFKFLFNKGHFFEALDQEGNRYPTLWKTLVTENLWENRSTYTFSLNEVVSFYLFNALGVPSPRGHWSHFRTVMQPLEQPDPWFGDFWGLMFVHEDYDKQFLDAHGLPEGNLYKLTRDGVSGLQQLRYQAPDAVSDGSDHDHIEASLTGTSSPEFVTSHVHLDLWARYHALCEAIRHYDYWPSGNNNAAWYFFPSYGGSNQNRGVMWTLPSDLDATWGPTWNNGHDVVHNALFDDSLSTGGDAGINPALWPRYYNQVREIRDLLWQPDQINPLIDSFAAVIRPIADAEFKRWRGAPPEAGNFDGLGGPGLSGPDGRSSLDAYVASMKDFAFDPDGNGSSHPGGNVGAGGRAAWLDQLQGANFQSLLVPNRPTLTYTGPAGFPADGLWFESSEFSDPQGAFTFGAIQWRIAQVNASAEFTPGEKRLLEIVAAHDSGPLEGTLVTYARSYQFPLTSVIPGRRYRARVRHQDTSGVWSRWSAPVEFSVAPLDDSVHKRDLMITEIMYHPAPPTAAEQAVAAGLGQTWASQDFEYLELRNLGTAPLDLRHVSFIGGISHTFAESMVLAPGATAVLVSHPEAFQTRYGQSTPIAGRWAPGKNLGNGGDTLRMAYGGSPTPFLTLRYDDDPPWPVTPDGSGPSLVLMAPETRPDPNRGENWRASYGPQGSPGTDDRPTYASWATAHGVGGPQEDPDGDGWNNLVEFALGGHPKEPGGLPLASASIEAVQAGGETRPFLVVSWRRIEDTRDVSFAVLFSPELLQGWQANGVLLGRVRLEPGWILESWRAPVPADLQPAGYGQLRILRNF